MDRVMERLLSEYLHGLSLYNEIKFPIDEPLKIGFGDTLDWHFLCCSSRQIDELDSKPRLTLEDFKTLMDSYTILAKSQ